jgi:hypothetical protein
MGRVRIAYHFQTVPSLELQKGTRCVPCLAVKLNDGFNVGHKKILAWKSPGEDQIKSSMPDC